MGYGQAFCQMYNQMYSQMMMPPTAHVGYYPMAAFNPYCQMPQQQAEITGNSGHNQESAVDVFCSQNGVDPSATRQLKEQPLDVQEKVIAEGFLTGTNKSAVLMSRVRRINGTTIAPASAPRCRQAVA